jgi:hypothetical protein
VLAEKIQMLLDAPEKRRRLAEAGREFILENFDAARTGEIARQSYLSALERK